MRYGNDDEVVYHVVYHVLCHVVCHVLVGSVTRASELCCTTVPTVSAIMGYDRCQISDYY